MKCAIVRHTLNFQLNYNPYMLHVSSSMNNVGNNHKLTSKANPILRIRGIVDKPTFHVCKLLVKMIIRYHRE